MEPQQEADEVGVQVTKVDAFNQSYHQFLVRQRRDERVRAGALARRRRRRMHVAVMLQPVRPAGVRQPLRMPCQVPAH